MPAPADHGTGVAAILVGDARLPEFTGLLPGAELYAAGVFKTAGYDHRVVITISSATRSPVFSRVRATSSAS